MNLLSIWKWKLKMTEDIMKSIMKAKIRKVNHKRKFLEFL